MKLAELKRQFEAYLKQRGYKKTKNRFDIIDMVAEYGPHFEIENLVNWITHKNRRVASRSTVYRTVKLLQEFGAIREVVKLNNRTIYEFVIDKPHHEHLVCVECGRIIEFYKNEIEELQDEVCKEHNFTPLNHRLEIFGICSSCEKKEP